MVHLTSASDDDDDGLVLEDSKSTLVTEAGADDEPHGQKLKCVARQLKRRRQRAKKKQREESQQGQSSPQQVPLNDLSKPTAPPCGRQVGAMRRNVTPPMSQSRNRNFRKTIPDQHWWQGNLAGTVRGGCYRGPHHPPASYGFWPGRDFRESRRNWCSCDNAPMEAGLQPPNVQHCCPGGLTQLWIGLQPLGTGCSEPDGEAPVEVVQRARNTDRDAWDHPDHELHECSTDDNRSRACGSSSPTMVTPSASMRSFENKISNRAPAGPTQSVPDALPATTMTNERLGAMGHASTSRTQKVDGRSSPRGGSRRKRETVSKNTMTEPDTSTVGCGTDGFGDALHSLCRTVCKLRQTQLKRKRWESYLCFGREYPDFRRSFLAAAEENQWTEREKVRELREALKGPVRVAMAMVDGDSREFQVLLAYLDDMFGDTSEYERMARCLAAPTRREQDETLSFLAARIEAAIGTAKRTVAEQDAKVQYTAAPRTANEISEIYKEVAKQQRFQATALACISIAWEDQQRGNYTTRINTLLAENKALVRRNNLLRAALCRNVQVATKTLDDTMNIL